MKDDCVPSLVLHFCHSCTWTSLVMRQPMRVDWTRAPMLKHALGEGSVMSESGAKVHSDSCERSSVKNYQWFEKHRACFCYIVAVQSLACVSLQPHGLTVTCQASLSSTVSLSLLKVMSIELVMPSNYLISRHPLLFLPSSLMGSCTCAHMNMLILTQMQTFKNKMFWFCIMYLLGSPKDWNQKGLHNR